MDRTFAHKPGGFRLAGLLFTAAWTVFASPEGHGTVNVTLDVNDRSYTLVAPRCAQLTTDARAFELKPPGLNKFQARWSATVVRGGKQLVLSSAEGEVTTGEVTTIRFLNEGAELVFRLEPLLGSAGVTAQAGLRNIGTEPVELVAVTPVVAQFQVSGERAEWLVTGLHPQTPVVSDLGTQLDVYEYGGLYRRDGAGFLFGPAGEPVCYVNARFTPGDVGKETFEFTGDMGGVSVGPGETRWGQQVALVMEKPRTALVWWTEWVARTHGARTAKGALSGWNSWYSLRENVTGDDVLNIVEQVTRSADRLRADVIQMDWGGLYPNSIPVMKDKFPLGLPVYAQRIAATGARPGIKMQFRFPTCEQDQNRQEESVRRTVADGYSFLKIEHEIPPPPVKPPSFAASRAAWAGIRKAAGEDAYLLFCSAMPNRATLGFADSSRVGPAPYRVSVRDSVESLLRSCHLNGRWYAADNDVYYMATELRDVDPVVGGWPLARTWISLVGMSGGAAITSDLWHEDKFKPYWRNVEVMTPPAKEEAEVLDLCTGRDWPRLVGHVRREWGNSTVALLWNPGTAEQAVTLDFAQAGLDPNRRYAVWSFWDDRYLGVAQGSWTTPRLGASASQHLVLTDLGPSATKPVFIGSNLHIWCGAAEVGRVRNTRAALVIELTDAGARSGDLYVYSRYQPVFKKAAGCAVSGVTSAGENVWRISLKDRQRGTHQMIAVDILLPVTRQLWFWGLIAGLVASLVLAAWHYVAGLRLQRTHALDQERARIARDIHDDLGTSLTRISVLAENATTEAHGLAQVREEFGTVRKIAREMTRTMDEIVWAINPSHDLLDSLASYFGSYAERAAKDAGLRCRLDLPFQLPGWRLSAERRHQLFLAYKEAVGNVLKHARATEIKVGLTVTAAGFELFVEDNGQGLPRVPGAPGVRTGNGLVNMCNRLAQMRGTCRVDSPARGGTRVTFAVPATAVQERREGQLP